MSGAHEDILAGKTIGQLLAEGFEDLATEIRKDKTKVASKFTCHRLALDLSPEPYSADLVKRTRKILGASQAVFAQFLGVSPNTVRAWEQGINTPRDSACRLMDEIRHNPAYFEQRLRDSIVLKKGARKKALA
ncbi:MAG: helix-turn-helix domain-containing protein [Planctomycetaceae bacterium]